MKKSLLILFFFILFCGPQAAIAENYSIIVNFSNFRLSLVDGNSIEHFSCLVCLPKFIPELPISGKISKIEFNPYWYPTEGTREAYLRKSGTLLPKVVPPGAKNNAMGKVKIGLVFDRPGVMSPATKIHGTNQPDSIGKRLSRSCIRLLNSEAVKLAEMIQGHEARFVFR